MTENLNQGSLTATDQLHLNTAAGFLQIGEPMDAWNELESSTPLNRAKTAVLTVQLNAHRNLRHWVLAKDVAPGANPARVVKCNACCRPD